MSNVLDILLQGDEGKMKKPSKEVELTRLSGLFGSPVIFTCEALSTQKFAEIKETISIQGKNVDFDVMEMQVFTVLEGVKNPSLKSKELREKYNALTPKELINKLLLPGEVAELYNVISELSGFGEDVVKEVKN